MIAAARWQALAALAVPVLGGLIGLALLGAPHDYLLVNAGALALAGMWVLTGRAPQSPLMRRMLTFALLALLFAPLLTGPEQNHIARWLPLGPFALHAGMLALPALTVLASRDSDYAAPILLTALLAAFLMPDAGTGFAVVFAAIGLHHVSRSWQVGMVCIAGFFASLIMAVRGPLPPVPFVERLFVTSALVSPLAAAILTATFVSGFFLMLRAAPLRLDERFALAGSLFGFGMMALIAWYPTPLVGYGAAPILGYGLALGLRHPARA